jgi:hypothetical protein
MQNIAQHKQILQALYAATLLLLAALMQSERVAK